MELKCSLCHRDFDEFERVPRIIPECGHSYCQKCIRNAIQDRRSVFTCPIDGKSHLFRKDPGEVIKNMIVITAIREQRQQTLAKSRNLFAKQFEADAGNLCEQHQKPCQFRCINDGKLVCAHCALFGEHKGHELQSAGKLAQSETRGLADNVRREVDKLDCCIKEILQPPGILTKQLEKVKRELKVEIKEIFKNYHETINRKEAYMEKEIEEIIKQHRKGMAKVEQQLEQNLKTSRLIKDQAAMIIDDLTNNSSKIVVAEVRNITERITAFKPLLLRLDEDIKNRCREFSQQWKSKFKQTEYFKIQELFPTFVESEDKTRGKSNKHQEESFDGFKTGFIQLNSHQSKTPIKSLYSTNGQKMHTQQNKTSGDWQRHSQPDINDPPEESVKAFLQSQKEIRRPPTSKQTTPLREKDKRPPTNPHPRPNQLKQSKKSVEPRKKPEAKSRQKPIVRENIIDERSRVNESMHAKDKGSMSVNGRNNSPQHKEKKKQLKFEARQRIDGVLAAIDKQPGPNLELIGLEIRDSYIPGIFEFIKKSGRRYGLIKFVKNELTNEGIAAILHHLLHDDYAHTLNMTSNCLTEDCLDSIVQFLGTNKALKNFYLTGNNINSVKVRQKKKLIQDMGINLYL